MNPFTLIFFHFLTFLAGGLCFANLTLLIDGAGIGYEASWLKVGGTIICAIWFAAMTHTERRPPEYKYRVHKR